MMRAHVRMRAFKPVLSWHYRVAGHTAGRRAGPSIMRTYRLQYRGVYVTLVPDTAALLADAHIPLTFLSRSEHPSQCRAQVLCLCVGTAALLAVLPLPYLP